MKHQYHFAISIFIGIVCSAPDTRPLSVKFKQSGTQYAHLGKQLSFLCDINRNLRYIIEHDLQIAHASAAGEFNLTQRMQKIGPNNDNYIVNITLAPQNGIHTEFYILNVTDFFDGRLKCRVTSHSGVILQEDGLDIVVLRPVNDFHLRFDNSTPISKSMTDAVVVYYGSNHSVTCTVEGSNPAASVHLYSMDGIHITRTETITDKMETKLTKFRTTFTAFVQIKSLNSNLELQCVAQSKYGDERSVKLPIKTIVHDLDISCNESSAKEGQLNVVLSCTVDYSCDDIESFTYSHGDKDYSVGSNHNESFIVVSRQELSDTRVIVRLELMLVKDWHFKEEFYLNVKHFDGRVTRYSVKLKMSENCAVMNGLLMTPLVSIGLFWVLKRTFENF